MKYIEEEDLVVGEQYMCMTYSGTIISATFHDDSKFAWQNADFKYLWGNIRYVLCTVEYFIKQYK